MRILAVLVAASLTLPLTAVPRDPAGLSAGVSAGVATDRDDALVPAVAAALPARPETGQPRVTVRRQVGGWAFGSAVRPVPVGAPAYPEGWLWVARHDGGWQVALEGGDRFTAWSRAAPVLRAEEQAALAGGADPAGAPRPEAAATDYRTRMRLPFAVGQAWRYTGGPHPMTAGGPRSSVDFAGGDGRVRAARAGVAYTMCDSGTGWVRVVHDGGFATDYYHLEGAISADGRQVAEGEFLGRIGTDVTCGGHATGPHVHFSLRRDGAYVPIDRYSFGKWSIRAGATPYDGFALHGSTSVEVGGRLHNYGALASTEAVVDTNGGGVLNRRAGPGTGHAIIGTIKDGATVRVECSRRGTTHTGRNGYTSDLWNRLADGGWASDVYLWTGTGAPVAGWC